MSPVTCDYTADTPRVSSCHCPDDRHGCANPGRPRTRGLLMLGARPDCMKAAPLMRAMVPDCPEVEPILVHTGQHYDLNMPGVYFTELELSQPDVNLEVGS